MKTVLTITILWTIAYAAQSISSKHAAIKRIIVDARGKGDFKTVQGAINSLS